MGNPLTNQGVLVQTSLGYSNTYNGGYSIQITDTNGCTVSNTLFLDPQNVSPQFNIDSISEINPSCFGDCNGRLFAKMFDVGIHSIPPFTYYWFNSNGDTLKVDSLGSVWYNPSHVATYTNRCAGNYELHAYDFYNNGPVTAQYSLVEPNDIIISNAYNQPLLIECGKDTVLEVAVTGGNLTNDTILLNDVTINIGSPNTPNIFGFSDT